MKEKLQISLQHCSFILHICLLLFENCFLSFWNCTVIKKSPFCSKYSLVYFSDISAKFILPVGPGILQIFNLSSSALFRWENNQNSITLLNFNYIPWSSSALREHVIFQNKCSQLTNLLY